MRKSTYWWFKIPGEVYANDVFFKKPVDLNHAKRYVRAWLGVTRLPRGTQFWPGR